MRILTRYIITAVIAATLLVWLALLGVESFLLLMMELSAIGRGDYHFVQALVYVLLNLPSDMYQLFPMVMLLGSLIGLGGLAAKNELVVMQAAGVSKGRVIWAVLQGALILFVVAFGLGEGLGPISQHAAVQYKQAALHQKASRGTWVRQGHEFIHVAEVQGADRLRGVTAFTFDAHQHLQQAMQAQSAHYVDGHWQLTQVRRTVFQPQGGVTTQHFASQPWSVRLRLRMLKWQRVQSDELSLRQLHQYIRYRHAGGLNATHSIFSFWQRIFQPFAMIVMICLAVPFIFGTLRSHPMGTRILFGASVAFAFYMLNAFFGPFTMLYHIPPELAAALPSLLVMLGGSLWWYCYSR